MLVSPRNRPDIERSHHVHNNQTIASAAGTLSAIIFVLPGLIIVGWWSGFPYLQTVLVIVLGGILGVTYSIPLRRALVTNSDLPYPEGVATISNDNLQDLKTGQLVDSTPSKQQVALVIGAALGAIVIPPVLSLMQGAFGFAGAPDAGDDALAVPQANLIKHLVQGVLGGDLNWSLLGLGALIGAVAIAIDEILRRNSKYSLPPLAVGRGMYLPTAVTVMIPIGAALGHLYDRWAERTANPERAKRMGTLMATGLIVGESLIGVVYAGIVVAFVGTLWYLYRGARQESTRD